MQKKGNDRELTLLTGSAWQTSADGWVYALRDSEREWEVQTSCSDVADRLHVQTYSGLTGGGKKKSKAAAAGASTTAQQQQQQAVDEKSTATSGKGRKRKRGPRVEVSAIAVRPHGVLEPARERLTL